MTSSGRATAILENAILFCFLVRSITAAVPAAGGAAGALAPLRAATEQALFERVATLKWSLPYCPAGGSPWSPRGALLAVDSAACRLGIFDATHPGKLPRSLLVMPSPTNMTVAWSPDGRWILCHTKTYSSHSIEDSLWVVPVGGGRPMFMREGSGMWPFLWGSDGYIYYWEDGQARRLTPPSGASVPEHAADRTPRLASVPPDGIVRLTPGEPPQVALVRSDRGLLHGAFPDGRRFLLELMGQAQRSVILGADGTILGTLDGAAREDTSGTTLNSFSATSVTSDGRFVIGFYEIDRDEDIAKAPVFLVDTLGSTRIPVEGACYSTRPELSPAGHWLALEALRGGVEVGILKSPP